MSERPRISPDLRDRINAVRGDVPFQRWVARACVERLEREGALEAALGGESGGGDEPGRGAIPRESSPVSPRAPSPRRGHKDEPPPEEPVVEEVPEPGDEVSPNPETPSAVQLAQRCGVTLSMARRWLQSGEWAVYWT